MQWEGSSEGFATAAHAISQVNVQPGTSQRDRASWTSQFL